MELANLLSKTLETDSRDVWENERIPTPVRRYGVYLHTAELSTREMVTILELLDVETPVDTVVRDSLPLQRSKAVVMTRETLISATRPRK